MPRVSGDRRHGRAQRRLMCQVWVAYVGLERPVHQSLLNPAETARRVAYRQDVDRARFTLGAALLRRIAAQELGTAPEAVPVIRSCPHCWRPHGKPRIDGSDLHVSAAHSGGKVLLAVTREAPVGVDIEVVVDGSFRDVAELVLAPDEHVGRAEDFFTYWCRKESVLKATGEGLGVLLNQVVVTPADEPPRLRAYRGALLDASMRDLPIESGYAAAVTVLAHGDLVVCLLDAAGVMGGARGAS
jgi:4'-phosphopantetheinyl transferase